ncbi:MAG: two-component system response regulator GlrR [Polyangiales bacterium]|jgi:two-component system response regulator GlrR
MSLSPNPSTPENERTASLIIDLERDTLEAGRFCLTDRQTGAEFECGARRTRIGTGERNDVRLEDRSVSRFHCEITLGPDGAQLCDTGSSNGTYINGVRVEKAWLHHDARIRVGNSHLTFEVRDGSSSIRLGDTDFGGLIGSSTPMRALFAELERAAASDATVLLQGETGTGKTAAARAIHNASRRAAEPFVVVDLGTMPEQLAESELFGHEQGSFTGAYKSFAGAFERAKRGTVFLDEIGEISPSLQPKLLRVIENRTVRRIGASRDLRLDIRVVAATHRDLRAGVNAGDFRADLFYRIAVLETQLPALRDHPEDIPLLCEALLRNMDVSEGEEDFLSPSLLARLQSMRWPGNVRQLRNQLERYAVLGVPTELMPDPRAVQTPYEESRANALRAFERDYVRRLLDRNDGNVTKAAAVAGIARGYLHRIIRRSKLDE